MRSYTRPIDKISYVLPSFKIDEPEEFKIKPVNQDAMKQLIDDMNAGTYDPDVFMSRELSKMLQTDPEKKLEELRDQKNSMTNEAWVSGALED